MGSSEGTIDAEVVEVDPEQEEIDRKVLRAMYDYGSGDSKLISFFVGLGKSEVQASFERLVNDGYLRIVPEEEGIFSPEEACYETVDPPTFREAMSHYWRNLKEYLSDDHMRQFLQN